MLLCIIGNKCVSMGWVVEQSNQTVFQKFDFHEFSRSFYMFQEHFPKGKLHSSSFQEAPRLVATLIKGGEPDYFRHTDIIGIISHFPCSRILID